MNAIDFVVRTPAGVAQRDVVQAGADQSTVLMTSGAEVSFNLSQSNLRGYSRVGEDLHMTLADGRVIVLEGYFAELGEEPRLFLSSDGQLHEVFFAEGSDGVLFAEYGKSAEWGKWSPDDALIHYGRPEVVSAEMATDEGGNEVGMLAAGLLGGGSMLGVAGAAGAAAVGAAVLGGGFSGGGSSSGGGSDDTAATGGGGDDTATGGGGDDTATGGGGDDTATGGGGDDTTNGGGGDDTTTGGGGDDTTTGGGGDDTTNGGGGDDTTTGGGGDDTTTGGGGDDTANGGGGDDTTTGGGGDDTTTGGGGNDTTDGGGSSWVDPTVDDTQITIGGDGVAEVITVTGTGDPGDTVTVTIGGSTVDTVIDGNGDWSAVFEGGDFPVDGTYTTVVDVTDGTNSATLTGPDVVIDTTPPPIDVTDGTAETGDLVNMVTHPDGVTVIGTGEAGASITVTIDGVTHVTNVDGNGDWSVHFGSTEINTGEFTTDVTITSEDSFGNSTTITQTLEVDTIPNAITIDTATVAGDGIVNATEAASTVTVTGTATAGASLVVTVAGTSVTVVADASGNWSADLDAGTFVSGEYLEGVTVTSVDAAGNESSISGDIQVDTVPNAITIDTATVAGDGVVNDAEAGGVVTLTGTATAGASLVVTVAGTSVTVVADASGNWSADLDAGTFVDGEYLQGVTVTSVDAAGNESSVSGDIQVDTVPNSIAIDTASVAGDGVVNAVEAGGVVAISGTATAGADVAVTVAGVTTNVTADADGNWSFDLPANTFAGGTYSADITAVSVDAAGNSNTVTGTVQVDTENSVDIATGLTAPGDVLNGNDVALGVTLTGTTQAGSSVDVQVGTVTLPATVDASGNWTVTVAAADIPSGTHTLPVTVTSTDAAGNVSTDTGNIDVDTEGYVTLNDDTVETDGVINADERADDVALTGTAEPGSAVAVTMAGVTVNTVADSNGDWVANFAAADVPTGEMDVPISVTAVDPAGNESATTGSVNVDTLVNDLSLDQLPGGADLVVNADEAAQGISLSGTVEPGSQLVVDLAGVSHTAVVDADGNWTLDFAAAELPSGEQVVDLTMTATDAAGNTRTDVQQVTFDTDPGTLTLSSDPIEGDDVVNAVEASDGVAISGTSDPGAVVTVTLGGATRTTLTDADGNWTTTFDASEIPAGTYDADITAQITDAAGNTLQVSDTVRVDTQVDDFAINDVAVGADNVINAAEAAAGVTVTGTTEPGATVVVTIEGVSRPATVNPDGTWSAVFPDGSIAPGEYDTVVEVESVDAAGNVANTSQDVRVDTYVNAIDVTGSSAGADGIVNSEELAHGDALTLTGQVEPGSTVMVRFNSVDYAATVAPNGSWTLDIPAADVPRGEYDAVFEVTATDAAGNPEVITETLHIDTEAPDGPVVESFTRDDSGLRGISTALTGDTQDILQVAEDGTISDVSMSVVDVPAINETNFYFSNTVPDGSDLIVSTSDDAGNTRSTYLVLDDETPGTNVSLDNSGLGAHNVEVVDLEFAEEANLTLTEADIVALSSETDTLTVHGGVDDTVTITGATRVGTVTNAQGENFVEYSLGDATVLIDEDITNVVI